ncbi:MAG: hypothetical protein Q4A61_02010 [Porphyromonadaceae bacterium]|nr:hypothetical protein [Porphyromonadaceae bacterium]
MKSRLTKHINQLLSLHPCVSVPGLGSFLLETQPAYLDHGTCLIYPTTSELCFNELLQHQDGLLAQSYADAYAISHRRARLMVDEDVRSLRNHLIRRCRITLDGLGTLSLNESGNIVFEPQNIQTLQSTSYGLPPVALPTYLDKESDVPHLDSQSAYLHLRISKRGISWVSAVAILILAALPWGKQVEREPLYQASIAPTELRQEGKIAPQMGEVKAQDVAVEEYHRTSPTTGMYHVIIAVELSFERAELHYTEALSSLPKELHETLDILQDKKRYLVSAAQFTDASQAYAYIKEMSKLGKEAWVYRAK